MDSRCNGTIQNKFRGVDYWRGKDEMKPYHVEAIAADEAKPWILLKHYARRMPCVQHSFGLYNENTLEGVVAYGPTCRSLNNGYGAFGGELKVNSFELLRLCIDSKNKNAASILISKSLKMLTKPAFIVSYADPNKNHIGYVYQATNWIFCGVTQKECLYLDNGKEVHARTIVSRYGSRKRKSIPNNIIISEQEGKYRYVYFLGSKKQVKEMYKNFKYEILPYPKGDTQKYDASSNFATQILLF